MAIGLGSNTGDRLAHLSAATRRLGEIVEIEAVSAVYETDPVHVTDQPRFLNACLVARTDLTPGELLVRLAAIETAGGRDRRGPRFGPRTIDLDILLYGDEVIDRPGLTIPHPRMLERAFVLVPLADVAPNWQHPVAGRSMGALRADAADEGVVRSEWVIGWKSERGG